MVLKLFYNDWAKNAPEWRALRAEDWSQNQLEIDFLCCPRMLLAQRANQDLLPQIVPHSRWDSCQKNEGKGRKTGYRPLGKLFLIVFVVFFPAGQACFLALIVWHWQQAACSDTHRSNESPTSEVFTTHQWMRIDFENCLRITLQKFPVHHQRTSIKFNII